MGFLLALIVGAYALHLGSKITKLEQTVARLRVQPEQEKPVRQQAQAAPARSAFIDAAVPEAKDIYAARAQQQMAAPPVYQASVPAKPNAFFAWLQEDFLVKLGAFLLIIAFGWFVNYAFANNWIGPIGRITLGLMAGVMFMLLGVWRIPVQKHQGSIFTVLGSTIVLLTVFAAREVYDYFTPVTALLLMSMSVVFVAFVSVRYKRGELAIFGLVLAGIAPFLTNAPDPDAVTLLSYLLMVVLGTLWVVRMTGSNVLTFSALIMAFLYSIPIWATGDIENELIGLLFAFAFTAIFFISNILGILKRKLPEARQGQIVTAVLTGLYLVIWIAAAAPEQWQSLLYIAWMLVFSSGAFVVYVHTSYRVPFYIYGAVGIMLMAAATAVELDGALLTIAYTIQATAIVLMAALLLRDTQLAQRVCGLFIFPAVLSLEHLGSYAWRDGFLHEDFFALLILAMSLMVTSLVLMGLRKPEEETSPLAVMLGVAGVGYVLMLVWLVTHAVLPADAATTISLLIYLSLIHISEPTRLVHSSRMPSSA